MHQSSRSAGGLALHGLCLVGLVLLAASSACAGGDDSDSPANDDLDAAVSKDSGNGPKDSGSSADAKAGLRRGRRPGRDVYDRRNRHRPRGLDGRRGARRRRAGRARPQERQRDDHRREDGTFAFTTKVLTGAAFDVAVAVATRQSGADVHGEWREGDRRHRQRDERHRELRHEEADRRRSRDRPRRRWPPAPHQRYRGRHHRRRERHVRVSHRPRERTSYSVAVQDEPDECLADLHAGQHHGPRRRRKRHQHRRELRRQDLHRLRHHHGRHHGRARADEYVFRRRRPGDHHPAANATTFAFLQPVRSGQTFAVTAGGTYHCSVTGGAATMAGANVSDVAVACTPATFDYAFTGAAQSFVVPAWATALDVVLEGAQGGTDFAGSTNYGGKVTATVTVTPGETLSLFVGGQPGDTNGGYNGGGNGESGGRGGGGATDLRRGATLADRLLVAGGGGGAGYWASASLEVVGGAGGGLTGGSGYRVPDFASNPGGEGATQTGSGNGTCISFNNPAVSGGLGYGGAPSGCGCQGYGGGGGYYGGAGSGNCRGGGGGSGFAAAVGVTNVVQTPGGATPGMDDCTSTRSSVNRRCC